MTMRTQFNLLTAAALVALAARCTHAAVWEAPPAPAGAPVAPQRVRIVKQGMETHRNDDGHVHSISSFHRYRLVTNATSGLLQQSGAGADLQSFNDYDVDGDGMATNDTVRAHVFSWSRPLNPDAPFYDTSIGSHRFFGGLTIYTANTLSPFGFSEDGMNDYEEGPAYQPRKNWTYFNEVYAVYEPYRMYGVWFWTKDDFLNGGAQWPVSLDTNAWFGHLVMRYFQGIDGFRWAVRENDQCYLSEEIYRYAGDPPGGAGGKIHTLNPTATRWAPYHPSGYQIDFDASAAVFTPRAFTNVTAVGYYLAKDALISGYVGHKWYTFEAYATVHRPARPSERIAMSRIPGAGAVQDFYLSACEVPYALWRSVYRLANNNCFALDPRGNANFDNTGDMGSMDLPTAAGAYLPHGPHEPVTDVTLYDVLVWCNALSIEESREPVYYEDAAFTKIFMEVKHSPFWLNAPASLPTVYVKWNADGFRLPTPKEWERAALAGNQEFSAASGWLGANASGTTHAVGGLITNALGCYDMAGNVWELTWPFGNALAPNAVMPLLALGGDMHYPGHPTNVSASAYGDLPYDGNYNIGFRIVRRDAGLSAPDTSTNLMQTIPAWRIAKNDRCAPVPARQLAAPLAAPWLPLKNVPGTNFAMGVFEVTFAQWQPVYDWAVAQGYTFDHDGDIGSMDYWGWGEGWTAGMHTPDEPVTSITRYDAMVWLNALSELEGLTPVYYTTPALAQPLRASYTYRPLMKLLEDDPAFSIMGWNDMLAWPNYGVKAAANGYRLPDAPEFYYTAHAGLPAQKYPWGADIAPFTNYAWVIDNAGLRTHPVGQLASNAWGFYDMLGNVSELSESSAGKLSYLSRERLGLGFFDCAYGYPKVMDRGTWSGLRYPDVGLRVLRQNVGAASRRVVAETVEPSSAQLPSGALVYAVPVRSQMTSQDSSSAPARRRARGSAGAFAPLAVSAASFDPLAGQVHRGDLGRSGVFNASGVPSLKGLKWKVQTGGPVKSSPVVVNGIAYFGSHDGNVYAVDADTGDVIWRAPTGGRVSGSAAVVSNMVFIASENGRLFCFNAQTGATNWSAFMENNRAPAGSPAVINGVVFIGAGSQYGFRAVSMSASAIYGFNMHTGAQVWKSSSTGPQGFAAIASDGVNLYAGIGGSSYAAFRISDGATVWTKTEGHQNRQFVSMSVVDGTVYFPGSIRGSVSAYTPAGTRKWFTTTFPTNSIFEINRGGSFGYEILADLAIAHGRVYAGCNDGKLHTFSQATGATGWTFQTGGKIQSSPAIASNLVYFGSWDGWLYALDAFTGKLQWKFNAGQRIISAPWVGNGVIYFGCDDGALYALASGGPAARILSATPSHGDAPLAVSFNARATAGDAAVSNCTWQFGDGSAPAHGAGLTNVIHTYESCGVHTAVFAVADFAGASAQDSTLIHVLPEAQWHACGIMPVLCALRCACFRSDAPPARCFTAML